MGLPDRDESVAAVIQWLERNPDASKSDIGKRLAIELLDRSGAAIFLDRDYLESMPDDELAIRYGKLLIDSFAISSTGSDAGMAPLERVSPGTHTASPSRRSPLA